MLLPEPDSPLTRVSCTYFPPSLSLSRPELGGRVDAAQLEDVVAHRGLYQHGEVAAGGDRDDDLAHRHAENVLPQVGKRQALAGIAPFGAGLLQMRDQLEL